MSATLLKIWRWLILGLLLASAVSFAQTAAPTADPLTQLQARIAKVPVLRGDFVQEKQLHGFKHPLRSQGKILVVRERGVLWTTLTPFPSELVLTADRILTRQPDGSTRIEVDAKQQPALRAVNTMLFALLRGDVQALSGYFNARPVLLEKNSWRLALTPKSAALTQAFKQITLEGDRYVRKVEIEEANGDRTHLQFNALRETPAQLNADEARRFD